MKISNFEYFICEKRVHLFECEPREKSFVFVDSFVCSLVGCFGGAERYVDIDVGCGMLDGLVLTHWGIFQ